MKRNPMDIINEDLNMEVGLGATYHCGSDAYPYYISELLPNNVIGLYSPNSYFDKTHPSYFGDQVVEDFDPNHKTEIYIRRRYGNWWTCDKNGKKISRFNRTLKFGYARSYLDPSF